ncbi:MAG: heme exporter protein CcmB [Gammaproteobacteria bacterium]
MLSTLLTLVRYDIKTTLRQAFSWVTPLLFFVIVVTLFPLAVGSDETLLAQIAPGIIWVAALLAVLLSIGNLFQNDAEVGHLDVLCLSPHPLTLLVLAKITSHWLTHCLPLILISPLLGFLLHFRPYQEYALIVSLLLGTPVLTLLGAIGAALIVGIRGHGLLLPILIMPLYIPVLIFGTGLMIAATHAEPILGFVALMGALMLVSLAFAPWFTAIALRIGVSQ